MTLSSAGYERHFSAKKPSVLHADGLKKSLRRIFIAAALSAERRTTTPVPSSEEGNYGAGKQILSNLRLARCKAADPWLWLAGLAVCSKREGVPLPRSGGGWEGANAPAAPYKHRLAHAPGRRSRSGRAFRCVGVLGFTPSRFWALLASQKCHPAGQACLLKPRKRLAPPEVITDHVTNAPAASRTNWAF